MSRQIWVNSYLTIISCFLTSSIALVRIAIMIFADIDENLLRFRSSKIFEVHVKSLQRSLWVFVLWSLHSGTWRIFSGSWTILQDPEGYSISKRFGPWEFYRILMYTICSFLLLYKTLVIMVPSYFGSCFMYNRAMIVLVQAGFQPGELKCSIIVSSFGSKVIFMFSIRWNDCSKARWSHGKA